MPATAAIGTKLSLNGTVIALMSDIEGPGLKGDTIDVTNHDNVDNHKEFIVGLLEGGDIKGKIFFDAADGTQTALITALQSRTPSTIGITYPKGGGWTGTGVLTQFDIKAKVKDALEADITIKISGKPIFG
jgi:predicted secreted protein